MEYLIGMLAVGVLWAIFFLWRKDLRYRTVWAGGLYTAIMTVGFFAVKFLRHVPVQQTIDPGYWSPATLFNLNAITGGYSIEDVLFLFFFGGIAAVIYELATRTPPVHTAAKPVFKIALPLAVVAAALSAHTGANLMYAIITFGFAGALVIWAQRPDLIYRSFIGGVLFLILYIALYLIFLLFYPSFVVLNYHLTDVSGIVVLGIPLEEYAFALGFGALWSVLYLYTHDLGERNSGKI